MWGLSSILIECVCILKHWITIEIAIHSILSVLNGLLTEINYSRFKNKFFKIDVYASSGFVIDASRKRVYRCTSDCYYAVCNCLTVLQNRTAIICLNIFTKHAKFTYCSRTSFSEKNSATANNCTLKCAFCVRMSVFLSLWFHLMPIYPIVFWHLALSVGRKQSVQQPWKCEPTGSEIADSIQPKNLYDQRHIKM